MLTWTDQIARSRVPERDRLLRAAVALSGSREDAEELVQKTYARILKRPRSARHHDDLAYLLRVLHNTWTKRNRARASRTPHCLVDEEIEFVIDHRSDPSVSANELGTIYGALRQLSDALRDTIVAVDVVGLSYQQAGRALGTPTRTIISRLYRAREQLAERLEGPLGQPHQASGLDPSDASAWSSVNRR
jgi:RNA polymerase sigma-70 factor (ECF subfamily)